MRSIKQETLADLLKKQQILLDNQIFDPYGYFGISQLRKNNERRDFRSPIVKIRKNYESVLWTSSGNKKEKGLNRSLNMQREEARQKRNVGMKPVHLKIDLNESMNKKNSEITSSRSASKLSLKTNFRTPQNSQNGSEKANFHLLKKNTIKVIEKRDCYFTEAKKPEKRPEKPKEKEGKKRILTENAEIMNTMKGLDAKYQGIYLNFVRANKKKN